MAYFNIGERIRQLRKERNLNQDQLAELASLNRVTIAKYEAGKVEPGAQALSRIADALEVTTDCIIGRSDAPKDADADAFVIREQLRRDPNTRILFKAAQKASPEHIRAAAAMLQALSGGDADDL